MGTWEIEGSRLRDRWRKLHKHKLGHGNWYGSDGDFFLVDIDALRPIAYLDIKSPDDQATVTEEALYFWLVRMGCPVFLVRVTDVELGMFSIWNWGWRAEPTLAALTSDWSDYGIWERDVRSGKAA